MITLFGRKITPSISAVIGNTSWLFVDRLLRMAAGFILGVWIARYLGVTQYGLLSYATAFVYLFNPLVTLGLDNIVIRNIVRNPKITNQTLGTTFGLRIIGSCIAIVLTTFLISIFRSNETLVVAIVSALSIAGIFQSMDVIDLWFQSQLQSKYTVFAKLTAFACIALIKVCLILFQASLMTFVWASLAEISLGSFFLVIIYHLKGHSLRKWKWNFSLSKTLLKEGFPLMLSCVTIMIYMKVDQIMLGGFIGDREVGIYTAATRISEASYFIPSAILSSVTPSIYKAKETSEAEYYRYIKQLLKLMNGIAIVIAIPFTVLAPVIIHLSYGETYIQSGSVLIVHVWAAVFVFMGLATIPYLIAEDLTSLALQRTALGAVTNILLNCILIPRYTAVGAAVATVLSQAISSYFSHALYPQTWKLFVLQTRSLILYK